MKLKPFKKEKFTKKQRLPIIIVGSLCLIFLLIAIYQSFAAYNIKHSETIVDAKVGSLYDIRILAIYIDNELQTSNDFPTNKEFSHVRCYVDGEYRENITGTWENNSLEINGFTSKTDCNVYFVSLLRDRIIEDNGGIAAIINRGIPDYATVPTNTTPETNGTGSGLFATRGSIPGWTDTNTGLFAGTRAAHEHATQESFYFRGHNDRVHNHVQFAGFWWRVIRIEGNGNIRLIYNGTVAANPTQPPLTGAGTNFAISAFNSYDGNNMITGFRHGTSCTSYATCHANIAPSIILGTTTDMGSLNWWYLTNIQNRGTAITSKIATNAIFCSDRNLYLGTGIGTTHTNYGYQNRLLDNKRPSLQCINRTGHVPGNHDQFGISGNGNGTLTYPIGLITSDEVALAGAVVYINNPELWLRNETDFWTMTPTWFASQPQYLYLVGSTVNTHGSFGHFRRNSRIGLRPVISLHPNVLITQGNGTRDNPFIVN